MTCAKNTPEPYVSIVLGRQIDLEQKKDARELFVAYVTPHGGAYLKVMICENQDKKT